MLRRQPVGFAVQPEHAVGAAVRPVREQVAPECGRDGEAALDQLPETPPARLAAPFDRFVEREKFRRKYIRLRRTGVVAPEIHADDRRDRLLHRLRQIPQHVDAVMLSPLLQMDADFPADRNAIDGIVALAAKFEPHGFRPGRKLAIHDPGELGADGGPAAVPPGCGADPSAVFPLKRRGQRQVAGFGFFVIGFGQHERPPIP